MSWIKFWNSIKAEEKERFYIGQSETTILRLRPGDILVLKSTRSMTKESRDRIKKYLDEFLPSAGWSDVKVLILDGGLELDVLRKDDAQSDDDPAAQEEVKP